jgi:glycine dehydrogenase subunit 2
LVYCDGANLNAICGVTRPADFGADVLHFNLHKTFSTPHGGGGPGAGPVGVVEKLVPFLPTPTVERDGDRFRLEFDRPDSIGRLKGSFGDFGILVRAYTYIRELGRDGVAEMSRMAVLNANYIKERLKEHYHLVHDRRCMHECVFSEKYLVPLGVHTMDVAKRLMDYGYHPPTVYFPLVVKGALMIEPTESESLESIDQFCESMLAIRQEAEADPSILTTAPHATKLKRLDEVGAARKLKPRWTPAE